MSKTQSTHKTLTLIQTTVSGQIAPLERFFVKTKDAMDLKQYSSVYSVREGQPSHQAGRLSVVFEIHTDLTPQQFYKRLTDIESTVSGGLDIHLLAYDDWTRLSPDLTLPHPDWHLRPDWIYPAAEIWPDYLHPVLNKSLKEISALFAGDGGAEFFAQGNILLDFYYNRR